LEPTWRRHKSSLSPPLYLQRVNKDPEFLTDIFYQTEVKLEGFHLLGVSLPKSFPFWPLIDLGAQVTPRTVSYKPCLQKTSVIVTRSGKKIGMAGRLTGGIVLTYISLVSFLLTSTLNACYIPSYCHLHSSSGVTVPGSWKSSLSYSLLRYNWGRLSERI
jgi:hypothetical protein